MASDYYLHNEMADVAPIVDTLSVAAQSLMTAGVSPQYILPLVLLWVVGKPAGQMATSLWDDWLDERKAERHDRFEARRLRRERGYEGDA